MRGYLLLSASISEFVGTFDKSAVADAKKGLRELVPLFLVFRLESVPESLHSLSAAWACVYLSTGDWLEASAEAACGGMSR